MRHDKVATRKRRFSMPAVEQVDALLDQVADLDEAEPAAHDSSLSAAALRDWPEIAGDVDEWVREHGGRGDGEQYT